MLDSTLHCCWLYVLTLAFESNLLPPSYWEWTKAFIHQGRTQLNRESEHCDSYVYKKLHIFQWSRALFKSKQKSRLCTFTSINSFSSSIWMWHTVKISRMKTIAVNGMPHMLFFDWKTWLKIENSLGLTYLFGTLYSGLNLDICLVWFLCWDKQHSHTRAHSICEYGHRSTDNIIT